MCWAYRMGYFDVFMGPLSFTIAIFLGNKKGSFFVNRDLIDIYPNLFYIMYTHYNNQCLSILKYVKYNNNKAEITFLKNA